MRDSQHLFDGYAPNLAYTPDPDEIDELERLCETAP